MDEEKLRWFLNDFAFKNPFHDSQACQARQQIRDYARNLHQSICDQIQPPPPGTPIVINIEALSSTSGFHSIYWETLEDPSLWNHDDSVAIAVTVVRVVPSPARSIAIPAAGVLRVLLVCARTASPDEIGHRTIAGPLVHITKSSGLPAEIHIVRPGTWKAFSDFLRNNTDKQFDIIHFDLHGQISSEGNRYKRKPLNESF
jgi:hypothetical protein